MVQLVAVEAYLLVLLCSSVQASFACMYKKLNLQHGHVKRLVDLLW